jgi:uncharacterized membrane-anchored protein YitT (DUF2179 family)
MSLIHIVGRLFKQVVRPSPVLTCPNCGVLQRIRPEKSDERFHCRACGFQVPTIVRPRESPTWLSRELLYEVGFVFLGALAAVVGLKGFLLPNQLIDGGVTGISMLVSRTTGLPLSVLIFCINVPFLFAAYHHFQREFAIRSALSILLLAFLLQVVPVPLISNDKLIDAVFGGFLLGAGIAFSIRGGGVLDGTEILALLVSRRFPATVGDVILFLNIIIFSFAFLILTPEHIFYSIITYFSASKTLDFVMHGIESFNGVMIISGVAPEIRFSLVNQFRRGVTTFKAKGGYSEKDQDVLFCVLTRLEISRVKKMVTEVDPNAFVLVFPISDVQGGTIRKYLHEKHISEVSPHPLPAKKQA